MSVTRIMSLVRLDTFIRIIIGYTHNDTIGGYNHEDTIIRIQSYG